MRLFAAVVPPRHALEDLAALVSSVVQGTGELDQVPVGSMQIPITTFGNVAQADAIALGEALRKEATLWPRHELRFAGAAALEWPGDVSVWSRLEGGVEDLETIARGVPKVVQRLGFLVDRRKFRPWLAVGDITDTTSPPVLQRLFDTLEAYRGDPWRVDEILVMRRRRTATAEDEEPFEVMQALPLGG